ncbi:hypothetical protein KL86DYS2_10815 [uncultured Dysgonomonas sp.]|uniref:Uncharacterized protein n=1 Tax=uncultured Dysgonomonas sp. TaxID=206096 RepID=A0A212J631_9BACT|nr:hypothetical protein [uncultured Dysgonomonas sp.]SBV94912.1 hypothetical protein KL86DYS2_10815 [uncultured Dysgonomonas sp.]
MLTLSFGKSTSPKFRDAVKLAEKFTSCVKTDNRTSVLLPVKEVFEKWEYFNQLFWTVVDWKETTLMYEDMTYHSHTDKTRIFYALQNAHWKWMNYIEDRVSKLYNTTVEELDLSKVNTKNIDDATADLLIDLYSIKKQ